MKLPKRRGESFLKAPESEIIDEPKKTGTSERTSSSPPCSSCARHRVQNTCSQNNEDIEWSHHPPAPPVPINLPPPEVQRREFLQTHRTSRSSDLIGPLRPVIFPSSAHCSELGGCGSVTSLPRTTTGEGGRPLHTSLLSDHRRTPAPPGLMGATPRSRSPDIRIDVYLPKVPTISSSVFLFFAAVLFRQSHCSSSSIRSLNSGGSPDITWRMHVRTQRRPLKDAISVEPCLARSSSKDSASRLTEGAGEKKTTCVSSEPSGIHQPGLYCPSVSCRAPCRQQLRMQSVEVQLGVKPKQKEESTGFPPVDTCRFLQVMETVTESRKKKPSSRRDAAEDKRKVGGEPVKVQFVQEESCGVLFRVFTGPGPVPTQTPPPTPNGTPHDPLNPSTNPEMSHKTTAASQSLRGERQGGGRGLGGSSESFI
ncbi:unnamed protein product [Pleuronectes platessa]|uniref:Uncharacterized protein n=1 Tax=Pleuronectes platessa TaxID=8262 RepID=A0A9N7UND6_PLEPL|nr:unnamed protein product [Pleuronectes platessa]